MSNTSLGPQVARYRYRPLGKRDILTHGLPGLAAVVTPLLYGFYRSDYGYTHYGPVAAETWGQPWYNLSLSALLVFSLLLITRLAASLRYISIHKNGVFLPASKKQPLRWEQIAGISFEAIQTRLLGIPLATRYRGVLYPNVGKPIRMEPGYENLPELLTNIKAKLYPRLLESLSKEFENGQRLHFGPVSIQKKDLQVRQTSTRATRSLPWSSIHSINIQSGFLMVQSKDLTRLRLNISDIPNIELLLQLIQTGVST